MFDILVAGVRLRIDNRHEEIRQWCNDYIVADNGQPDMIFAATDESLQYMCNAAHVSMQEAELHCTARYLYARLMNYDAFRMHGCAVEMNKGVYIFTAPAGYGKTTHARLWLEAYGEKARIINGDNPIIRYENDEFRAYGTPFCGKERYQVNTSAPIKGVCYLTHSETNYIRRMDPNMAFGQFTRNSLFYINEDNSEAFMDILARFVCNVPVYQLYCNQDVEAAFVAYEGMKNGRVSD